MKAVVFSLGCKVNQYEGQSMITAFRGHGIDADDKLGYADFYVINTCSVTGEADRKSRQTVARALKYNPDALVYICGCSSQNDPTAFADKPNVRLIAGAAHKADFAEEILRDLSVSAHSGHCMVRASANMYEDNLFPYHTKTRSYIKVQDGCNNFCSYCIIPYLRGRSRSRRIESVVAEAEDAARHTKEIVLTGINMSAYGTDIGIDLKTLVESLGKIPVRKRISSLECTVIDDRLLRAMRDNGFCDHFHLSLQSGSASVLRRMNRKYTPEFYFEKAEKIREIFPRAGITTDVITGFGGETDDEFAETVEFVRKVGFSDMHVFPYSERKGTNACKLPQVDKSIRRKRASVLIEEAKRMKDDFCRKCEGNIEEVYFETEEGGLSVGFTANYIKVYSDLPTGELYKVKIGEIYKEGVKGIKYE